MAAAFLAARGVASGTRWRELRRLAAARRFAVYGAGFAVAFAAGRVAVALSPERAGGRYAGSDPRLGVDAVAAAAKRLAVGLPPWGWQRGVDHGAAAGLSPADLARDPAAAVVCAALGALVVVAVVRSGRAPAAAAGRLRRLAAGLGIVGAAMALSGAAVAGLAVAIQHGDGRIRHTWRDTLLVQTGWALIAAALAALALSMLHTPAGRRAAAGAAGLIAAAALALALLTNWRIADAERRHIDDAAISLVSAAAMLPADDIALGVARCNLAAAWAASAPPSWREPERIIADIDRLWLDRYGFPFCDRADAEP